MSKVEILQEIKSYSPSERLILIESILQMTREDMQKTEVPGKKKQLREAAEALMDDYKNDSELTVFTSLDGEAFHE